MTNVIGVFCIRGTDPPKKYSENFLANFLEKFLGNCLAIFPVPIVGGCPQFRPSRATDHLIGQGESEPSPIRSQASGPSARDPAGRPVLAALASFNARN